MQHEIIAQLPEVMVSVEQFGREAMRTGSLDEAGLTLTHSRGEQGKRCGRALWAAQIEGRPVALAWNWAEGANESVAMTDPMAVETNVLLSDREGRLLDDMTTALQLNVVIHELRWQEHLLRSLC
jgi:hypothetical protein